MPWRRRSAAGAARGEAGLAPVLLEAGGEDKNPWIHIPIGYGKHFDNPKINWMYWSKPGEERIKRKVRQPRGKVIGGTSSINGLVYMRGQKEDYDHASDSNEIYLQTTSIFILVE